MDISKESVLKSVKACLLKAWRERWSDMKWGVQLKHILSSSQQALTDSSELADIMVHQALVGISPNQLVLSYFKHAVSSHVISYGSALRSISKYEDFSKHYCIAGLLDLTAGFTSKLSFSYGAEAALVLAQSLLSLLHWLLTCTLKFVQKLHDTRAAQSYEYSAVIEKACYATSSMLSSSTVRALLYIAYMDNPDLYREMEQTKVNVRGTVTQPQLSISPELKTHMLDMLKCIANVEELLSCPEPVLDVSHLPICPSINALVALETLLNPTSPIEAFVEQISVIEKLLKLSRSNVCLELFRACFMGLLDSAQSQEELKWSAFTFLKLPQILLKLQASDPDHNFSAHLETGLTLLIRNAHLLDLTDRKYTCDCLQILLLECNKHGLLTDTQFQSLLEKRCTDGMMLKAGDSHSIQTSPNLILRAEPTVSSILKTLDSDYSKNQEALLGVLCHMLSGKSFELLLAAAAATGKLQSFSSKLVKFNEFAKQSSGESQKASQTRALLFDKTFLMLCHISQLYGADILLSSSECLDSFFVQWATRCLPEDGKYKSVDNCAPTDSNKVDILLSQFYTCADLKTSLQRWHDVCFNAPFAIQEVLYAWEHHAITSDNVKMTLDSVKAQMCCLPVVVCAALCSYINTVGEEARDKPLNMLHQLMLPLTDLPNTLNYHERSHLMVIILKRMTEMVLCQTSATNSRNSTGSMLNISSDMLAVSHLRNSSGTSTYLSPPSMLTSCLSDIFNKSWLDLKAVHMLEHMLTLCSTDWLCEHTVQYMLNTIRPDELQRNLSLVFSIFHIDLEAMTLSLLLNTLANILQFSNKLHYLIDPKGSTLAKLVVMCICATRTAKLAQKGCPETAMGINRHGPGKRRHRGRFVNKTMQQLEDFDDLEARIPSKVRKLVHEDMEITLHSEGFSLDVLTAKEDGEISPSYDSKDPLNKAIVKLFAMLHAVARDNDLSPRSSFTVSVLEETIRCGTHLSKYILQFMPANMICQLMKALPEVFTDTHLLHLCDLSRLTGRQLAAKAVCQNARYRHNTT